MHFDFQVPDLPQAVSQAEALGARKTAEQFGFNDNFLFRDVVVENSTYPTKNRTNLEIAWSGDGQSQVSATPLHMCMVAAAVANDGVMMEPRLLSRVESPSGVVRLRFGLTDGQPRTLDEIGQVYGVTRERIRQIESKTMSKLRHPSRSQVLRDYLD